MDSIATRLNTYLTVKGLNAKDFERITGLGNGTCAKISERTRRTTFDRISNSPIDLDVNWLLTGEGAMLRESPDGQEISMVSTPMLTVPLYSLETVAGFSGRQDQPQYVEAEIPWANAKDGDFAVHVTGNSMEPKIPNGSLVLVRPYPYLDYTDLEFGRVHIIVTNDGRAMLKVVKLAPDKPRHILLISFNPDYPARSIPAASIVRVFLAVSVQAPL